MPGQKFVYITGMRWSVKIANTPYERQTGLSGIQSLPPGCGMLFDMETPQIVFVTTQNMNFSLAVAFISQGMNIVKIYRILPQGFTVSSEVPVRYFLEVNAGEFLNIENCSKVIIADY
jgi:uncharacterized membrane protein (UPF0127 family)